MLWIKAFHVIFVVSWYAGLLYLPRLFVYHSMSDDEVGVERFKTMERKLFGIMTVGAIGAAVFGLWLMIRYWPAYSGGGWLHAKLALVLVLLGFHGYCYKVMIAFRHGRNRHGHVFFRWVNEIPALPVLVAVVLLVVFKPF